MSLPTQFYAVTQSGFRRFTITSEFIGPETSILDAFVGKIAAIIPGLITGITVALSSQHLVLTREMRTLMLSTFYRPMTTVEEKVILVPVWKKSSSGADMKFEWVLPSDMRLFFIATWNLVEDGTRGKPKIFVVAMGEDKGTYLLPLPNLYEDGRVCMGNNVDLSAKTIVEVFDKAQRHFEKSNWNADLLHDPSRIEAAQRLFRFDPEGNQLPSQGHWKELVKRTNHLSYQFIAKL